MENYNSLSVIYAIHMKMNDRSQSRVSNFNVYNEADNRVRDNKNTLRSVESRVLGVKQPGLLHYFFVWNTKRVLNVIMYILKK